MSSKQSRWDSINTRRAPWAWNPLVWARRSWTWGVVSLTVLLVFRLLGCSDLSDELRGGGALAGAQLRAPGSDAKSSTWNGEVILSGVFQVPAIASGSYSLQAGGASPHIPLARGDASVTEHFGDGAIGYRYEIGTLSVGTSSGPSSPTVPLSSWAQAVIDDMTLAS